MRELISGIYQIINLVNGNRYIGSSKDILKRKGEHFNLLRRGKHENNHLQNACDKFGIENLSFSVIEYCESDKETLLLREQYYMDTLKPEYNLNPLAQSCFGVKHTEESRRNMAKAARNRPTISEETRAKMSEKAKGNKSLSGYIPSEETRKKLSAALIGNKRRLGIPHTLEARKKMSGPRGPLDHKRKSPPSVSTETKEKIAAKKREWWANKKQAVNSMESMDCSNVTQNTLFLNDSRQTL